MERVRDKAHARNYPNTERTCVHHEDKKEIRSEATFHFRLFTNSCKAIRCKSSDGDIKQAIEEKKGNIIWCFLGILYIPYSYRGSKKKKEDSAVNENLTWDYVRYICVTHPFRRSVEGGWVNQRQEENEKKIEGL